MYVNDIIGWACAGYVRYQNWNIHEYFMMSEEYYLLGYNALQFVEMNTTLYPRR
jgi:hypothetical protein